MQNLKITFELDEPIILNRYSTIDSILLDAYFKRLRKQGKIAEFVKTQDYLTEISKFIKVENNTISGSVWYVPEYTKAVPTNLQIHKVTQPERIIKYNRLFGSDTTPSKVENSGTGEFKAFKFGIESLVLSSIYFYIAGDKDVIIDLLNDVNYLGKKISYGKGYIKSKIIEPIPDDKSFLLNETTPAKPLSCQDWNVKTHKVMFYSQYPPYWSKDKVACYMPSASLKEHTDNTYANGQYSSMPDAEFISPTKFAYGLLSHKLKVRDDMEYNDTGTCAMCGDKESKGIKGNTETIIKKTLGKGDNFNDFPYILKGTGFICKHCIWSVSGNSVKDGGKTIKDASPFDNLCDFILNKDGYEYIQSKKADKEKWTQEYKAEFFGSLNKQKLPFVIALKDTSNNQHVLFKSAVSISNALIPIQVGNRSMIIDDEILQEAIKESGELIKEYSKKLLTNFSKDEPINFTSDERLMDFYAKYDQDIRTLLNFIIFNKEVKDVKRKPKKVR